MSTIDNKINIAELLEDAPVGTKLYSPLFGEVTFSEIVANRYIEVKTNRNNDYKTFNIYGQFDMDYEDAECLLFPSKENRTWEGFKAPWKHKHFEPFQKVLVSIYHKDSHKRYWTIDLYSHYDERLHHHITLKQGTVRDESIIPYEGNEDKLGKEVEQDN